MAAEKIFADDTTLPVLDLGRGRTKTGRFWCNAVDDRPWCGRAPPAAAYVYAEGRKGARPAAHLANFRGIVQLDGYQSFGQMVRQRADACLQLAFCWVHARLRDRLIREEAPG
jgi:transposase